MGWTASCAQTRWRKPKWLFAWEVDVSVFRKVRWESLRDTCPNSRGYSACWGQSRCFPLYFKEGPRALCDSTDPLTSPQKFNLSLKWLAAKLCMKPWMPKFFRSPKCCTQSNTTWNKSHSVEPIHFQLRGHRQNSSSVWLCSAANCYFQHGNIFTKTLLKWWFFFFRGRVVSNSFRHKSNCQSV